MPRKRRTASTQSPSLNGGSSGDGTDDTSGAIEAPFFTLAIEGPNTAVALDASGNEIVSLHFEDFNELISDDFREFATAAVAATMSDTSSSSEINGTPEQSEVINLVDSDSEIYIEDDLDEIFAAVLAENESETAALAAAMAAQHLDADFALALRLQEEEEHEKEKEKQKRAVGKTSRTGPAWGNTPIKNKIFPFPQTREATPSDHKSFSNTMGTAPGISTALSTKGSRYKPSDIEFPSLPLPPPVTRENKKNTTYNLVEHKRHNRQQQQQQHKEQQQFPVSTLNNDDGDLSTIEFLDSYDGEAIQARATALRFVQTAAVKEENRQHAGGATSREDFKKMMDSSRPSSANTVENKEEDTGFGYNRKKKIRTLVMSMIAAGWQFMPERRGSGHYIYQRFIPPTGHKQILVLPCTPSSQRSIDAVHARLQRLDREAAAVRAAAVANQIT